MGVKKAVHIIDTTLRDGLQAPGFSLDHDQRMKVAVLLQALGVNEIEAGIPAQSESERQWIRRIFNWARTLTDTNLSITTWCRAVIDDLRIAADSSCSRVHFAVPISDILLSALNRNTLWLFETTQICLKFAVQHFDFVSLGFIDSFRAPIDRIHELCAMAREAGVKRIRISDTTGRAYPWDVEHLFKDLSSESALQIEFHGHNDLGLALANSISAIRAGADAVSVTFSGIGERAGNCRLEELAAAVLYMEEFETTVNTGKIIEASGAFRDITRIDPLRFRPVTGASVFTHESGIHAHAMLRDEKSFSGLSPGDFDSSNHIVYGTSSGRGMLWPLLREHGINPEEININSLIQDIHKISLQKSQALGAKEVISLATRQGL